MWRECFVFTLCLHLDIAYHCSNDFVYKDDNFFTLHTSFKHTLKYTLSIRWLHNNQEVSKCSVDNCQDDYSQNTRSSVNYLSEIKTVECNITVFNGTQDTTGSWSLKYLGSAYSKYKQELFKCDFSMQDQSTTEGQHDKAYDNSTQKNDAIETNDSFPINMSTFFIIISIALFAPAIVLIVLKGLSIIKKKKKLFIKQGFPEQKLTKKLIFQEFCHEV